MTTTPPPLGLEHDDLLQFTPHQNTSPRPLQLEPDDLLQFSPHRYKSRRRRQVLGSPSDSQQIPNQHNHPYHPGQPVLAVRMKLQNDIHDLASALLAKLRMLAELEGTENWAGDRSDVGGDVMGAKWSMERDKTDTKQDTETEERRETLHDGLAEGVGATDETAEDVEIQEDHVDWTTDEEDYDSRSFRSWCEWQASV